ncbi:MAG: hypothetical protein EPO28_15950 [Saprospiraceae bacterium]|nr:MAG: hypothetical protein EPO28_15950 [Saprospiraceae bacterium]
MPTSLPLFKQSLKRTIAGNLGQCIKQLEASLDPGRDAYNDCLSLLAAYNRVERDNLNNLLSRDEYSRELSQLTNRVLLLIDNLAEEDLSEVRQLREEVHERILVVTRAERRPSIERFFSKNYFKNVHYIHYGDAIPAERFDLAVLDDIESDPAAAMYMEEYVAGIACYVLYFGERFPLDRVKYANKVYFANSIFSLYARIREMLDFIKYYDGDTGR